MTDSTTVFPVSVAPMMDWTDRHCRFFHRLLSPHAVLYTEMVTAAALKHGDCERLLAFHPSEHPLVLQLGGSDPATMAEAAAQGAEAGYDEININVGCPSDRVQSGSFGACLMAEPQLVAQCVSAMRAACNIPVTVKTRIGIDDHDSWEFLCEFVGPLVEAGVEALIVHARKAILKGLSPKDNRRIPPLDYERVYRLKRRFENLHITLNGGVATAADVHAHLAHVDAVMIGREAYNNPYFLAELEHEFFPDWQPLSRPDIVTLMCEYTGDQMQIGARLNHISRHILGLFAGQPGARIWRRTISENAHRKGAGCEIFQQALAAVARSQAMYPQET